MKRVQVVDELVWYCPDCGWRSLVELVIAELTQDERQEMAEDFGVECDTGDFYVQPPYVVCDQCGEMFETIEEEE